MEKTFDDYLKASPSERRKMNMSEILGEKRLAKTKEQMSLEEAAENYIAPIENDEGLDYINFNGRDIKDAFIAGAKWQKSQMLKEAVEGEAEELYNDGESQCVVSVGTYFKPGDEVYVIPKED